MQCADTQPLPDHLCLRAFTAETSRHGLMLTIKSGTSYTSYHMSYDSHQFASVCREYLREYDAVIREQQREVEA